jgi:DNA repair protein RadD
MQLNFHLRPYQQQGVEALRASYRAGHRAPLYTLPTGGGKTMVFSYITRNAVQHGSRVCILVLRAELLRQSSRTLARWGVPHGVIAAGQVMSAHKVQVASVQTIVRRLERVDPPDLLIVDEAHHTAAGSWQKIIAAFPRARLLGVTATPGRLDGRGLGVHCGGYYDDLIIGPSIRELISGGYLVRPKVYGSMRHLDLSRVHMRGGDYAQNELAAAVNNSTIIGDAVEHYARICPGVPAIAFCASIEHARQVTERFTAAGWRAKRIDGEMRDDQRFAIVSALAEGDLDVMTSVDLVSEGFDVPACGAAILMRPTKSMTLYLQQIGRALRPAPGKECAYILDHAGNTARHGMPQEDRQWTLDGAGHREPGPGIKTCPGCYAILEINVETCPECEHYFADAVAMNRIGGANGHDIAGRGMPDEVAGTLVELTPQMMAQHREEARHEVARAQSREELLRIARQRGYNVRWVDHVMRARNRG